MAINIQTTFQFYWVRYPSFLSSNELEALRLILQEGLARVVKRWGSAERKQTIEELEKYQKEAKYKRLGMWEYGDNMADDDDNNEKRPPARRAGGKR